MRKIGLPWQPELAVGAVLDGAKPRIVINDEVAQHAQMDEEDIAHMASVQLEEIEDRRRLWRPAHRTYVPIHGRSAIVVDDGIATGATVRVALDAVRREGPPALS